MSEYESLRGDLDGIASSMSRYAAAVAVYTEVATGEIKALWADNAELRDELHALANRVETLTRARLTEPAEAAKAIVSRSHWHSCSECGVDVQRRSDGLIYDVGGLHTCRESERRIMAGAE